MKNQKLEKLSSLASRISTYQLLLCLWPRNVANRWQANHPIYRWRSPQIRYWRYLGGYCKSKRSTEDPNFGVRTRHRENVLRQTCWNWLMTPLSTSPLYPSAHPPSVVSWEIAFFWPKHCRKWFGPGCHACDDLSGDQCRQSSTFD